MSKKNINLKNAGGKFNVGGYYIGHTSLCCIPRVDTIYIEKVMYNDPATIVFWSDGTKSVSRCAPGDTYSEEVGLSLCILKRLVGSTNLTNTFKNWVPGNYSVKPFNITLSDVRNKFR